MYNIYCSRYVKINKLSDKQATIGRIVQQKVNLNSSKLEKSVYFINCQIIIHLLTHKLTAMT